MARIDLARLFSDDGGERYILKYYPDAADSFRNPHRKFKTREEKTASASLKRMESGEWGVTDFGDDQKWRNAIQIAMLEEGWEYGPALRDVCNFYNYQDETQSFSAKPKYQERQAKPDENEGWYQLVPKEFTTAEIRVVLVDNAWKNLGASEDSRREHAVSLFALYHFKCLESYSYVYKGKHVTITATEDYPIYCYDEGQFVKIYRPKAAHDKRFRYFGKKVTHYVHGLKQHQDFIAQKKRDEYNKQSNENPASEEFQKTKEEVEKEIRQTTVEKLKEVICCSGGSDGLNVAALGYRVIWLNSESETLTGDEMSTLQNVAYKVYNLPDIDKTGLRAGHNLALKYLNLLTIWLPDRIYSEGKDGKAISKDLRDYLKTHTKKNFDRLLETALPYRFWDSEYQYDDDGRMKFKFGRPMVQYKFNHMQAYNFLSRSGFARYKSERDKEGFFYVQVTGSVVRKIDAQEIKAYLHNFLMERWEYDDNITQDLINSMFSTNQLSISNLANLPLIELDFTNCGQQFQYLYFPNCTWKVTSAGIEESKGLNTTNYVWEDKLITYPTKENRLPRVRKLDPMFRIIKNEAGTWDIDILNKECMFFRFQINTARMHWRKELEDRQTLWMTHNTAKKSEEYIEKYGLTEEEARLFFQTRSLEEQERYRQENKFEIAGQLLTDAEREEQKLHLINRIYAIGFMMHRYKNPARAWCIWAMDNKLSEMMGDDAKSNGGSGKSLSGKVLHWIWRNFVSLSGRNPQLTKNPHIYDKVTKQTDLIIVDDCSEYLEFGFFYGDITGTMNPNPKQNQSFSITFDESAKIWFDSNFGDRDFSESSKRRKLVTAFSDYYHENNGSYRETRGPSDDFDDKQLFYDFDQDDWNRLYNFLAQCLAFYLSCPEKINPPMSNIQKRNLLSSMGNRFFDWAEVYFAPENGRLDKVVSKKEAKIEYTTAEQIKELSTQKFTEYCKKYAAYHGYIFQPEEMLNSQGRLLRDIGGVKQECIYFKTLLPHPDQPEINPETGDDMPF